MGDRTVKFLLNLFNLGIFILFCLSLVSGIKLEKSMIGLGSHLGWILTTFVLWILSTILSIMYMMRMEKFCVEIVEKFEGKEEAQSFSEGKKS